MSAAYMCDEPGCTGIHSTIWPRRKNSCPRTLRRYREGQRDNYQRNREAIRHRQQQYMLTAAGQLARMRDNAKRRGNR